MNPQFFRACLCASAAFAALSANLVTAQSPARSDKILTIAELRACMTLQQSNNKAAAEILQEQDAFKRDQALVKTEQAAVGQANDEARARSAAIVSERDALSALVAALNAKTEAAKTDTEKAEIEAERAKFIERSGVFEQTIISFNASQQMLRDRVTASNARIDAINLRNATINDHIEPQQKQTAAWRDQCGSRRFREEDEVAIKKELAAQK